MTPRTIFIAGNNDRAANARTGNKDNAARRMMKPHVTNRSVVMTRLARICSRYRRWPIWQAGCRHVSEAALRAADEGKLNRAACRRRWPDLCNNRRYLDSGIGAAIEAASKHPATPAPRS